MRVVVFQNRSDLERLRDSWTRLLSRSTSSNIFLTWEWLTSWYDSYCPGDQLCILAAYDGADSLRGVAALRRSTACRYAVTVPTLTFLGDGSNDSDYLDFIVDPTCRDEVTGAFVRHLATEMDRGTVLLLNELPAASLTVGALRRLAGSTRGFWTETEVACGTVHLPDSWENYLALLRPRFRTKVRSVLRNLESRSDVSFHVCDDAGRIPGLLPVLFDLHTRRWATEGKPGVFRWEQKREFYARVSPLLLRQGWLRLSWLEWKGTILACQYGFAYNGTYFHLQEGYEPASEHWNVGIGLRAWSVREFIAQGLREYDFLGGMGRHKSDWGAEVKNSLNVQIACATAANTVFCRGPQWERKARDLAGRWIPEPVLNARRDRLIRKAQAAISSNEANEPGTGSGWLKNAVAKCYLHAGGPALSHRLRSRYQLSPSEGRWPGVVWRSRVSCSARILCYHRVNDDGDPFFPATATRTFDEHMRYLADHHTVVGMTELLRRLEEGSAEDLLAITFDDGYQDNYQNALPVLERYGLKATIFLTTGAIDSREPLWFERLADALKRTQCEFLDMETDVPRRLWLRKEGERLDANGWLFKYLRTLDDAGRKARLDAILKQLRAGDNVALHGRMLTWNHIRRMHSDGPFEFGGHTVTHPFLSRMAPDRCLWEVSECKRRIEQELQAPVRYFAYPNGKDPDFSEDCKRALAAAGYSAAVTTKWGMNHRATDRMELRRSGPWETSTAMFAVKMDWYQLVNE